MLHIRDLRIALLARAVSQAGDAMTLTALSLLVATSGRPLDLTALLVAFAVPPVLLSGYAGRLVDHADSRAVLVGSGVVQVLGSVGLLGPTTLPWQVVCILLVQAGQSVGAPAWGALLPHIVGEDRVGRAAGLQQSLASLAWMTGPALGGLIYGLVGFRGVVLVDTVTFVLVVVAAMVIRTRRRPDGRTDETADAHRAGMGRVTARRSHARASFSRDSLARASVPRDSLVRRLIRPGGVRREGGIGRGGATGLVGAARDGAEPAARSGLRLVAADRVVLALIVALGVFVVALEGANVVESFLVVDVLHASPAGYGLVGLAMGVGIALGSLAAARVGTTRRRLQVVSGSAALMGLTIGLAGLAPRFWVVPGLFLLAGVGNGLINTLNYTILMGRAPESARGRVLATVMGLSRGCSVLALVLGGLGGQFLGPRATFVVGGALAVAVAPLVLRAVRHAPEAPRRPSAASVGQENVATSGAQPTIG